MSTLIFSLWTMCMAVFSLAVLLPSNDWDLTITMLQFTVFWPMGLALIDWIWGFIDRNFF